MKLFERIEKGFIVNFYFIKMNREYANPMKMYSIEIRKCYPRLKFEGFKRTFWWEPA